MNATPASGLSYDEESVLRLVVGLLEGTLSRADFYEAANEFLRLYEADNELHGDEDTSDELRWYAGTLLIQAYNQHYYGADPPEAERYFPMLRTLLERGAHWWRTEVQVGRWPPYEFFDPDPESLE